MVRHPLGRGFGLRIQETFVFVFIVEIYNYIHIVETSLSLLPDTTTLLGDGRVVPRDHVTIGVSLLCLGPYPPGTWWRQEVETDPRRPSRTPEPSLRPALDFRGSVSTDTRRPREPSSSLTGWRYRPCSRKYEQRRRKERLTKGDKRRCNGQIHRPSGTDRRVNKLVHYLRRTLSPVIDHLE